MKEQPSFCLPFMKHPYGTSQLKGDKIVNKYRKARAEKIKFPSQNQIVFKVNRNEKKKRHYLFLIKRE